MNLSKYSLHDKIYQKITSRKSFTLMNPLVGLELESDPIEIKKIDWVGSGIEYGWG